MSIIKILIKAKGFIKRFYFSLQQAATPHFESSLVQIKPTERIKLKCKECEKTFNFMSLSKCAEEVAQLDTRCYYHKRVLRPPTPEGFWNHLFTETQ